MRYLILAKSVPSHYSFSYKEGVARLFYSRLGDWSEDYRGKLAAKLVPDGDNFRLIVGKIELGLDICQLAELRNLLNGVNKVEEKWFEKVKWVKL